MKTPKTSLDSYRSQFSESGRAKEYERGEYAAGSYSSLLWEIEKSFLSDFVETFHHTHGRITYLDFACGTGRLISFLEDFADTSVGVDISEDMLRSAAAKVKQSTLVRADLTQDAKLPENSYDLITAFRFFS